MYHIKRWQSRIYLAELAVDGQTHAQALEIAVSTKEYVPMLQPDAELQATELVEKIDPSCPTVLTPAAKLFGSNVIMSMKTDSIELMTLRMHDGDEEVRFSTVLDRLKTKYTISRRQSVLYLAGLAQDKDHSTALQDARETKSEKPPISDVEIIVEILQ